jgi:putative ABC transport system substrate-binding protein
MPRAPGPDARRRALVTLALADLVLLRGRATAAAAVELRVILGASTSQQDEALAAIRRRFGPAFADADPRKLQRSSRPTAYVALGAAALQAALAARLDAPLVSLFASRQAFEQAVELGAAGTAATAIYGEPAPDQQMKLIASVYKRPVTVGVLLSSQTAHMETLLRRSAIGSGLNLEAVQVDAGAGLTRSLNRLAGATVLLVVPDGALYTPTSLRELLESTYRRRLPVIGFSAALVAAGTLASAFTDIEDTVVQLGSLVDQIAAGRLPAPRYPAFWRTAVNDNVARSLDVAIDEDTRRLGARP